MIGLERHPDQMLPLLILAGRPMTYNSTCKGILFQILPKQKFVLDRNQFAVVIKDKSYVRAELSEIQTACAPHNDDYPFYWLQAQQIHHMALSLQGDEALPWQVSFKQSRLTLSLCLQEYKSMKRI
jgi:hypothetical protein